MAFLFDTNAISEAMRPRPNGDYVQWLRQLPREEQFTSSIVVGEMYAGAYASAATGKWLDRIEKFVLPSVTVLNFDLSTAHEYGRIRAQLRKVGQVIDEADMKIAATAVQHGLTLVTANVAHFRRVASLSIHNFSPGSGSETHQR